MWLPGHCYAVVKVFGVLFNMLMVVRVLFLHVGVWDVFFFLFGAFSV